MEGHQCALCKKFIPAGCERYDLSLKRVWGSDSYNVTANACHECVVVGIGLRYKKGFFKRSWVTRSSPEMPNE